MSIPRKMVDWFNVSPKQALEDLQHQISGNNEDKVHNLACFLRHAKGISPKQVGIVLGAPDALSQAILIQYAQGTLITKRCHLID